jgi:hypothetical protein
MDIPLSLFYYTDISVHFGTNQEEVDKNIAGKEKEHVLQYLWHVVLNVPFSIRQYDP